MDKPGNNKGIKGIRNITQHSKKKSDIQKNAYRRIFFPTTMLHNKQTYKNKKNNSWIQ